MESSDEEPMDTGVQNGTQEDLDTSQWKFFLISSIYVKHIIDLTSTRNR